MKGLELNIHNKHSSLDQSLATEANKWSAFADVGL